MWKCCGCFSKRYEAPEVLELDYRHSSLAEVPPEVFTFERTLERLDLGSNQIRDLPPSLFHCHELRELDLCDNELNSLPHAIGSLPRLTKLDLSRNGISDVTDAIKNCKNLMYLDLSMNHLKKLPEGISQLVNLEELFLNDTFLEFLHANFGRLSKLKILEVRENALQSLPKSMNRLHNLMRLDIGQNDFSELPEVIGTMTNLTELWCDNNSIRSIPKFIGNLTKLGCVDVSQNEVQELSEEISKCTLLTDLTLNSNGLESLPDSFCLLENLTVVRLDSNSLQYLPEEFGNLGNLTELSMVSNILKTLPTSIGLLRKLHTLYLDDNLLSELPKEIGSCTALSVLSIAKNQLKEIPSEVGHLANLKVLTLSGNRILHLPVSILNIGKLGALWLSESQSKPLLQLNKEIHPSTGQHVLTCYLLPQLPSSNEPRWEDEVMPPRRSRPSIKFLTDVEPVAGPDPSKRGLLRAPTPYPKELRALAKHASHLRTLKEQNGEITNTDEPEYEGDYAEEDSNETRRAEIPSGLDPVSYKSVQQNEDGPDFPPISSSTVQKSAAVLAREAFLSKAEEVPLLGSTETFGLPPPTTFQGYNSSSNITKSDLFSADKASRETYGNSGVSEMTRKSPPPYHVAARRAAFFRSSGGAGSGRIGSPTPDTKSSPVVGGRIFPLIPPLTPAEPPLLAPTPPSFEKRGEGDGDLSFEEEESVLNRTYTISKEEDSSDLVSSIEENLDDEANSPDLTQGQDSKTLVENIETALESVDKRTTEFLRNDSWREEEKEVDDEANKMGTEETTNPPSSNPFTDNSGQNSEPEPPKSRPTFTGIPSMVGGGGNRGPAIPPKPSPKVLRVPLLPPVNSSFQSEKEGDGGKSGFCKSTTDSSSSTRIPMLNSGSQTKSLGGGGEGIKSSLFETCLLTPVDKQSGFAKTSLTRPTEPSVVSVSGGGSRIPKLPSFSSTPPTPTPLLSSSPNLNPKIELYQNIAPKKPEILSAKPTHLSRGLPTSRIPSFGPGDPKIKEHVRSNSPALVSRNSPKPAIQTSSIVAPRGMSPQHQMTSSLAPSASTKIPRMGTESPADKPELKRSGSGSRIPKSASLLSPTTVVVGGIPGPVTPSAGGVSAEETRDNPSSIIQHQNNNESESSLSEIPSAGLGSKIPSFANRKPWIFGTHRNARVVPVEYRKMNGLGFTVSDGAGQTLDGQGIYVVETESADSALKVGDKILQVDGIDVSNMTVEIVKKILGNCQENINLLVSRQN